MIFFLAGIMTTGTSRFNSRHYFQHYTDKSEYGNYYYIFNLNRDSVDEMVAKAFGSYYLLFNQFIPFELIIILEMVKIHYTILMESDIELYNEEAGNRFLVQNLSMHEEIG